MRDRDFWSYRNPVRIVNGPLESLNRHVQGDKVLIVTTPGFVKRGVVKRIEKALCDRQFTVWDGVKPNPDAQDLDFACRMLRSRGVDCVVGLGGGSALDAAKVLATILANEIEGSLQHLFRLGDIPVLTQRLPLVAVPTTAGTGSEVTPFATVWDHDEKKKYSLAGDYVFPDVALIDKTLTLTLSDEDTLYPALDAISHSLESLWNKNRSPVTRAFAYQALALATRALPLVMRDPSNNEARGDMQHASILAGLAISQTRTAIAHAISYPLTTRFGVPHGLACSFTLPTILENRKNAISATCYELAVLDQTSELLEGLNLGRLIQKFASKQEIQNVQNFDLHHERMGNFIGELSVESIIQNSVREK